MTKGQRKLTALCMVVAFGLPTGSAFAGSGTPGPGECLGPDVGANIADHAKDDGPNAGPNTGTSWFIAPGAPAAPGQAVTFVCIEGNF
jgi:hypothetical protein